MASVVILEDEVQLTQFLIQKFPRELEVISFDHWEVFLKWLYQHSGKPLVVILDRLIHGLDVGLKIPELKVLNPTMAILVLSAIDSPLEKARLLDLGADDYLGKPFDTEELLARIRKLMRLVHQSPPNNLRFGDLEIDFVNHSISGPKGSIELTLREWTLLLFFVRQRGRIFSKYELLELVWHYQADVESNVVEVTIKNLRKKLQNADSKVRIKSQRGVGYWIED